MDESFKKSLSEPTTKEVKRRQQNSKGYHVKNNILFFQNGDNSLPVSTKIEVIAQGRNESQSGWGKLITFCDPDENEKEVFLASASFVGDTKACLSRLADEGLVVYNAQRLTNYLQSQLPEKRIRIVNETGWYKGYFVLPGRTIAPEGEQPSEEIRFGAGEGRAQATVSSAGTAEEWKEKIGKLCAGNSRAIVAVSQAFASTLANPVASKLLGIHFNHDSSNGKTTLMRVAASVVGGPDYILSWKSTSNGLVAKARRYNDLPMILDEIGQKDARDAGDAIYALYNGIDKIRAGRDGDARETKRFNVGLISSGEVSPTTLMQAAGQKIASGQEIRLIDIPADAGKGFGVFDHCHGLVDGAALSKELTEKTKQFYGAVGIQFIQNVARDKDSFAADFKGYERRFRDSVTSSAAAATTGRVADSFALIAYAGEQATDMGLTGWEGGEAEQAAKQCFLDWLKSRGGCDKTGEESAVITAIREFLEAHRQGRFISVDADDKEKVFNLAGWRKSEGGTEETFYIQTAALKEALTGFDLARAKKTLVTAGILTQEKAASKYISATVGTKHIYEIKTASLYKTPGSSPIEDGEPI